jgi:hypothetical protein
MPKPTRDQLFQISFKGFIDHLRENDYPDIQEYSIVSTTNNKQSTNHSYVLTLPRETLAYTIEVDTVDQHGILTPAGPVMRKQEIPTINEFSDQFTTYFNDNYVLKEGDITLSYMRIRDYWYKKNERVVSAFLLDSIYLLQDITLADLEQYDIMFTIDIVYYKSHKPYPVALRTKKELRTALDEVCNSHALVSEYLQDEMDKREEIEKQYETLRRTMRIERRTIHEKYRAMFDKMQRKCREYYEQSDKKDDCPVCYESIPADKLEVPGCCHTICSDCAGKCLKCPICREGY